MHWSLTWSWMPWNFGLAHSLESKVFIWKRCQPAWFWSYPALYWKTSVFLNINLILGLGNFCEHTSSYCFISNKTLKSGCTQLHGLQRSLWCIATSSNSFAVNGGERERIFLCPLIAGCAVVLSHLKVAVGLLSLFIMYNCCIDMAVQLLAGT